MRTGKIWLLTGAVVAGVVAHFGSALATPASGFSSTTIALGRFGDIEAVNQMIRQFGDPTPRKDLWLSLQRTKGPSDLYVQSNVWQVGGSSGWHTHPGHSLIIVTAGTVTAYDGNDSSCTPKEYTVGMGFVDSGGDHIHLIRNEDSGEARSITVQLLPAGATRRIDAEAPQACLHIH
jgi:hypothetical protein